MRIVQEELKNWDDISHSAVVFFLPFENMHMLLLAVWDIVVADTEQKSKIGFV